MSLPAKVQSRSLNATSSSATLALAYSSNLGAANLLVAACIWGSNTQTCTVASSNNGSWTAIGSPQRGAGNLASYTIQLFYKLNSTAGADTVTMTCSGSNTYRDLAIHEFSGIDLSSALDGSVYSGNVTASGNVITTASGITIGTAVELLFCAAMVDNAATSAGTGFTLDELANFGSNITEHMMRYAAGTYTATANVTGTTDASMILVGFKVSAPSLGSNNNSIVQSYSGATEIHTASAGTALDLTSLNYEHIEIDSLCMRPNVLAYFEIVAKTSVSLANQVKLNGGQGTNLDYAGIEIPTGTTSYTYFRSQVFTLPIGDKLDFGIIIGAGVGGTTSVIMWRVNILQGSGSEVIRTTETQIEIGNFETGTNTSGSPLAKPKYWLYTAANYDGLSQYFVSMQLTGTGGTVTAVLQQDDGSFGSWTNFLTIFNGVLNGNTWPITAMPVPTNGRHYRLTMKTSSGTWGVITCKILVDQFEGGTLFDGGSGFYNAVENIQGGTGGSGETSQAKAQSFKITNACTLTGVRVTLKKTGTPADNLSFDIVSSLGGGSLANGTLAASSVTTSWAQYDITFGASFSPTLNTQYYVQMTRSGARDTSNYCQIEADTTFNDQIGQGYNRDNNAWASFNYDILIILIGAAGLKKIEMPFQLLNTGDAGTGLQNMMMKYVAAEWSGWTATPYHQIDSNNASNSGKLTIPPSTDISGTTVTGNNEQISSSFSWPADGSLIDENVINSTGDVLGSRIIALAAKSSGNTYTQTNTGALTPSGILARVDNKTLAGGLTPTGILARLTSKKVTGGLAPSGILARAVIRLLSGGLTPSGTLSRVEQKRLSGGVTPTGGVTKLDSKLLTGGITPTGIPYKQVNHTVFTGGLTPSGVLSNLKAYIRLFTGGLTPSGTLAKVNSKPLTGSVAPGGALTKLDSKVAFIGGVSPSGTLANVKAFIRLFTGAVSPSGTVTRVTNKALSGAVGIAGGIVKKISKMLSGVLSSIGDLINQYIPSGGYTPDGISFDVTVTSSMSLSVDAAKSVASGVEITQSVSLDVDIT